MEAREIQPMAKMQDTALTAHAPEHPSEAGPQTFDQWRANQRPAAPKEFDERQLAWRQHNAPSAGPAEEQFTTVDAPPTFDVNNGVTPDGTQSDAVYQAPASDIPDL